MQGNVEGLQNIFSKKYLLDSFYLGFFNFSNSAPLPLLAVHLRRWECMALLTRTIVISSYKWYISGRGHLTASRSRSQLQSIQYCNTIARTTTKRIVLYQLTVFGSDKYILPYQVTSPKMAYLLIIQILLLS